MYTAHGITILGFGSALILNKPENPRPVSHACLCKYMNAHIINLSNNLHCSRLDILILKCVSLGTHEALRPLGILSIIS